MGRNKKVLLFAAAAMTILASGCHPSEQPASIQQSRIPISMVINKLGMTFPDGMDENENPYIHYIREQTNLDLRVNIPPEEVYEEKLNVIMASGSRPDLIHSFNPVWFDEYVKKGAFLPLDDYIEQYGQDLKQLIPEEAWERMRYNGKIYSIPSLTEVQGIELMYARKDWLDNLGLEPPETLDEYYEVIRAFAQDDPDQNGLNDTIGLILMEDMGRAAPFFGAFGVQPGLWLERDGKLANGSTLPETKEALAFLAKLYREGLMDPVFPLNRNNMFIEKIANGQVGMFSATWYDTRGPIAQNKKKDPNAEWIPLAYPVGPRGDSGVYDKDLIRGYNVVPAGTAHPEEVVKLLNFIAGAGREVLRLGFEGEIWNIVEGKMVTNFEEHDKHLYRGIYQSLVDVIDPVMAKTRLDSLGDFHLYENLQIIEQNLIRNEFYGNPTPAMSKYSGQLEELQNIFTSIVLGIVPLDRFDSFVEEWKREGGDKVTDEVNRWRDARPQSEEEGGS
ncbi:extracellular solute-binding protein [Paenibacillus agaridevorans]|uniref:extracellular solute-binding protein n=1 Tax=Paenibacillus agaridevorans TaxID=171404 RepID=UPI001BE4CFE4|nr:extracellular solute-binding protein [Paenibacillus agaridevorans]